MRQLTDGERDIIREQEEDARPSDLELCQMTLEATAEALDAARDRNAELVEENERLRLLASEVYEALYRHLNTLPRYYDRERSFVQDIRAYIYNTVKPTPDEYEAGMRVTIPTRVTA